jgi:peptidoglycan/LPS O-acetylase OafA/YrhL
MTFRTIQALRALAAVLIVLIHSLQMWGERVDLSAPGVGWQNGATGVDIFFVISGFVMVISSSHLRHVGRAWLMFLKNRVLRIVPLYWLLTTLKLIAVVFGGALALRSGLDLKFVAGSYLFLPVIDHARVRTIRADRYNRRGSRDLFARGDCPAPGGGKADVAAIEITAGQAGLGT